MKNIFLCFLFLSLLSLSGCATIKTIEPTNNHVNISYFDKKSYCSEIPRIYSGLAHNFCLLYGEPSTRVQRGSSINGVSVLALDSMACLVTDTIVLFYTIVRQSTKGNIKVN